MQKLCLIFFLGITAVLFAQQPEELRSRLLIGGNYTWVQVTPSGLASTSGHLGGLQGLYEYRIPESFYGALAVTWHQGNTSGSGTQRSISYVDVQERVGYNFFPFTSDLVLTLFTGLGYCHDGEDVVDGGSTVPFNYDEFYIPVGFLLEKPVNNTLSLGFNFQWMPQVFSSVTITPLKGARWILGNQAGNFRIETPLIITLSHPHHGLLVFEPYFQYWQDGHTSATTATGAALGIPKNTYLFAGINVNFGVSF